MSDLDRTCIRSLDRGLDITVRHLIGNAVELQERIRSGVGSDNRIAILARYGNEPEIFSAFLAARASGWPIALLPHDACGYRVQSVMGALCATFGGKPGSIVQLNRNLEADSFDELRGEIGANSKSLVMHFELRLDVDAPQAVPSLQAMNGDPESAEPILFLFTSGTTGHPKGIGFHRDAIDFFARNILRSTEVVAGSRELLIPSAAHSDGWQRGWATMLNGGQIVMVSARKLLLEFENVLRTADPDSFFLPSPLIPMLLKVSDSSCDFLNSKRRSVELGSTAIPETTFKKLTQRFHGLDFYYHYGLTECSRTSTLKLNSSKGKWGSVGQANQEFVLDTAGATLRIKNPHRPRHFLIDGQLQYDDRDYLITQDLGHLDEDGYLFLRGRTDDMLTLGGHHIFPNEIEKIVMATRGVRFCRVVRQTGSYDPIFGDQIDVQVVLDNGNDEADVLAKFPAIFRSYVSVHEDLNQMVASAKGMKS